MNMNIQTLSLETYNWNLRSLDIAIRPVIRGDKIKAFITWIFKTTQGDLIIKGFTIRLKELHSGIEVLSCDAPAYKAAGQFRKSFFFDNKDLYKHLCVETVRQYCKLTGELEPEYIYLDEAERSLIT